MYLLFNVHYATCKFSCSQPVNKMNSHATMETVSQSLTGVTGTVIVMMARMRKIAVSFYVYLYVIMYCYQGHCP